MSDDEFTEKPAKKPRVPKRKPDNVTVLVLDIGRNMQGDAFRDAVQTAEWLLTRTIMRQKEEKKVQGGEDLFGLVIFGSDDTQNELDTEGVVIRQDVLYKASFDQMRLLSELVPSEKRTGDFMDALIVSVDWLNRQLADCEETASRRIVLLTNGDGVHTVDTEAVEAIEGGMKQMDVELHVVGVAQNSKHAGPQKLRELTEDLNGHLYDFSNAGTMISRLSSYQKLTRLVGFTLQIAKDVKLPFKCIPYISKARSDKEERMRSVDPTTLQGVSRTIKYFTDDGASTKTPDAKSSSTSGGNGAGAPTPASGRPLTSAAGAIYLGDDYPENGAKKEEPLEEEMDATETTANRFSSRYQQVEKDDLAFAYLFGTSKVVMTDEDRAQYNLSFNNKEKGGTFELICTAPKSAIRIAHLAGDETRVFIPDERKDGGRGVEACSAFVHGLDAADAVAIARYAWNKASQPQMVALMPRIHPDIETPMLYAVRLPFADDIRHTEFPPLDNVDSLNSVEKIDAIDNLIDAFTGGEKCPISDSRRVRASYLRRNQYIFKKVNVRTSAIREDENEISDEQKNVLDKVAKEFPIIDYKELRKKEREKKQIEVVDVDALAAQAEPEEDEEDIKPIRAELDAKIAKAAGDEKKGMQHFLKDQFAHIIVNAGDDADQIELDKLKFARAWCVRTSEPKLFNDVMRRLRNLDDVVEWALERADPCLRPISKGECKSSTVFDKESERWWLGEEDDDGKNGSASNGIASESNPWRAVPDSNAPDLED